MTLTKDQIITHLAATDHTDLLSQALELRNATIGDKVYLRGLIEYSNRCSKDCLYCGIRGSNHNVQRYELDIQTVMMAVEYAIQHNYGSVVLQAGEQSSSRFVDVIEECLIQIKQRSNNKLGITLSLGEQSPETYARWRKAGAHRYLLRIESSNPEFYAKIHPASHSYHQRLECLKSLRQLGYQVGTGVMIGLPGQTLEHLADDLLFLQKIDIDMCGMGPYIEHPDAPLGSSSYSLEQRLNLSLRMIALLRILMPEINIASTTALHALHPQGREMGIAAGANIIMPNITPPDRRPQYKLYNNKPMSDINLEGFNVEYGAWGDSAHFSLPRV